MTNQQALDQSQQPKPRIFPLNSIGGLFITGALALLFGFLTLMGTSSRDFFDRAPTQASIGMALLLVGGMCILAGIVLDGVRAIAQQHLDELLRLNLGDGEPDEEAQPAAGAQETPPLS